MNTGIWVIFTIFDEICDFVQLIYENPPDIFFQKFATVPQEPLVYPLGDFNDLRLLTARLDHSYSNFRSKLPKCYFPAFFEYRVLGHFLPFLRNLQFCAAYL